MNNGGQDSGKRKFLGHDFAHAIGKVAMAQICEAVEINAFQDLPLREGARFNTFQDSALEALTDVALWYMHTVGKMAHSFANLGGRTEGNVFDIIQALEDLGSGLGFAGASDVDCCVSNSGIVKDILHYIGEVEGIPFAYSVPAFPVSKDRKQASSFLQIGEFPPDRHIPAWLPAFSYPKTIVQSDRDNERTNDTNGDKAEKEGQNRDKHSVIVNVNQLSLGDRLGVSLSFDKKDAAKSTQAAENNPFLSAPLHFGVKEVSLVVRPSKLSNEPDGKNDVTDNRVISNHVPVLETIDTFDKMMKNILSESEKGEKREPVNTRSLVQFKIGTGKKPLGMVINLSSENKGIKKIARWFREDDDKDEK